MEDIVYWLWLSQACTPGHESFKKLISKFNTPFEIFSSSDEEIASVVGKRCRDYQALTDKDLSKAQDIYSFCKSKGVGILTYSDERFPCQLREISAPPVLLYYRGALPDFSYDCMVSIVGTRRLTDYGRKNAFILGRDLGSMGVVVVSGMAVGIDGVAMAGAISAGGRAVAFIGSGIDVCYPECHLQLARETVKQGCIMTEYAPGTKPFRDHFPQRNRLISGLSSATVIIEGKIKSGALITARHAKLQGKMLFALPGNVDVKTSEVANLLIKEGAKLITDSTDIIKELEGDFSGRINPFSISSDTVNMMDVLNEYKVSCVTQSDSIFPSFHKKSQRRNTDISVGSKLTERDNVHQKEKPSINYDELPFDEAKLSLYKKIPENGTPCSIEELVCSDMDLRKVMRLLLSLEMGSYVKMLPGGFCKRNI